MKCPVPTPIYRFLHIDNLPTVLDRGALHAPNSTPADGLPYKTIHNVDIQNKRQIRQVPCGPRGVIHDYVAFYFGPRSPMLFQLHTGRVEGYSEGQEPLIYVVSSAQAIQSSGTRFVFTDGHGIAAFTTFFDDLADLTNVDWDAAYAKMWSDTVDDMDRQRRKQAEFLVYQRCDWALVQEIGVLNATMKSRAEATLAQFGPGVNRRVLIRPAWYYGTG